MDERSFNDCIDNILVSIEEQLDELDAEVDYENQNGVLDIVINDTHHLIINRQSSHQQLWLAAPSGGYHFEYHNEQWLDTKTNISFVDTLNRCLTELSHETIKLSL